MVKTYRKRPGPKLCVRLSQVSALEHVRFNQVLLYYHDNLLTIVISSTKLCILIFNYAVMASQSYFNEVIPLRCLITFS